MVMLLLDKDIGAEPVLQVFMQVAVEAEQGNQVKLQDSRVTTVVAEMVEMV